MRNDLAPSRSTIRSFDVERAEIGRINAQTGHWEFSGTVASDQLGFSDNGSEVGYRPLTGRQFQRHRDIAVSLLARAGDRDGGGSVVYARWSDGTHDRKFVAV